MGRILITGGRSAVALDLARHFRNRGIGPVFVGDSLDCFLASYSNAPAKKVRWASPRFHFDEFRDFLLEFVERENVACMVPTCEEVFYLSEIPELRDKCFCWWDEANKIKDLHNKWIFNQKCAAYGLKVPRTALLGGSLASAHTVLKPAYSRFASRVLFSGDRDFVETEKRLVAESSETWLVQERIFGQEYCSYSIALLGQLRAHVCYGHDFTAGRGAGISFEVVRHPGIFEWVRDFVAKENYTGQIAFDFIEDSNGQVWALEANPRATSGLHLLTGVEGFAGVWDPDVAIDQPLMPPDGMKRILSRLALLVYGVPTVRDFSRLKSFTKAYFRKPVLADRSDWAPAWGQMAMLGVLRRIAKRKNLTMLQATTDDIEWNGRRE